MAQHAGIPVFATGGIGGVHRGVAQTDDVSADLTALARIPVAVVCAGAKAILDLPRTVERLETLGVPVFGWRCDEFPAFWRRSSGLKLDQRFDDMAQMAEAIREHFALGTGTGIVIANPVPEADELDEFMNDRGLNGAVIRTHDGALGIADIQCEAFGPIRFGGDIAGSGAGVGNRGPVSGGRHGSGYGRR